MPVIQLQDQLLFDGLGQRLEPVAVIARQGDVQRHDVLNRIIMNRPVAVRRASRREPVQKRLATLLRRTAEKVPVTPIEQLAQVSLRRRYRSGGHFEHQVMLITLAVVGHTLGQMVRKTARNALQYAV